MANFGALTDHFSAISTGWTLLNSSKIPVPKTRADGEDGNGDVAAATWHGATDIFAVSCDYMLKTGTVNLNTLKLGELSAVTGLVVDSIGVSSDNKGVPKLSIRGRLGCEAITAPSGYLNTFTLPSISLAAAFRAQPMGFTVSAGKLTACTFDFSGTILEENDGVGVQAAHGFAGGIGALNATFTRIPDETPAWSLTLSGLTETQAPGESEPQAGYHTAVGLAEVLLTRDADA